MTGITAYMKDSIEGAGIPAPRIRIDNLPKSRALFAEFAPHDARPWRFWKQWSLLRLGRRLAFWDVKRNIQTGTVRELSTPPPSF
jgi:hypothetical protein